MPESSQDPGTISAPGFEAPIEEALARLDSENFPARLWARDATLWKSDPAHQAIIRDSLGWLEIARAMAGRTDELRSFADEIRKARYRDAVVLGMGGSSLCPALFAHTFASAPGFPRLHVLDSTVPAAIETLVGRIDPAQTIFIVASKSGGTIETLSHFHAFYDFVSRGSKSSPGANFIAITDPGTPLEEAARETGFRRVFLNPPDIGGRYSALSYFGLVPAALMGIEIDALLDRALGIARASDGSLPANRNAGVRLGGALGALRQAGVDKITFIVSPSISDFGLWVEQLIAESTGKEGRGLIPVCDEPPAAPECYGEDRVFVYLRDRGNADAQQDRAFDALRKAGKPSVAISVAEKIDLGGEFLRWEIATATAGSILGIDAFDQPNVQESKDNTGRLLAEFEQTGRLPDDPPAFQGDRMALYCGKPVAKALDGAVSIGEALERFFAFARKGDYFAVMAYLAPDSTVDAEVAAMREAVLTRFGLATTFGYGPRFLHSTGQLHKGGPNTGLFLQITQDHQAGVPIPGRRYDFALLNRAQYLGDFQALEAHRRRVIRIHLRGDRPVAALSELRGVLTRTVASKTD